MALLSDYTAGTVSSSGNVITGTGTAWQTAGYGEGDEFIAGGWRMLVQSVDSETQITLRANSGVQGSALSGASYRLRYMSDGSRASAQARQLIDLLSGTGTLEGLAGLTTAANKMPYFTGPGGAAALADLTPFARTLLDDTNAAAARATLSVRERLTANRTYYVRPDGNNANTGLTDSAGGAFATIAHALAIAYTIDLSIYDVTINVADGSYTGGAITASSPPVGYGRIFIIGNEGNPSAVTYTSSLDCFSVSSFGTLYVRGMRLVPAANRNALYANGIGQIFFQNINFAGGSNITHLNSLGGVIQATGPYSITGGGARHVSVGRGGQVTIAGVAITLVDTPGFSQFALVSESGRLAAQSTTFTGAATGQRYNVNYFGLINTGGGGESYLPGSTAGTDNSGGGRYV